MSGRPSWVGLGDAGFDIAASNPERVAAWRAEEAELKKEVNAAVAIMAADRKALLALAERVFANDVKVRRYIEKQPASYPSYRYSLDMALRDSERRRELTAQKARGEDEKSKATALIVRATAFMIARGKVVDVDFKSADVVRAANDLRFDELIAAAGPGPHEFDGQNCDGPCDGWDGEDRRCECGNRRVSWEREGDFEDMYIRAGAY